MDVAGGGGNDQGVQQLLMSRSSRIAIWTVVVFIGLGIFLALLPSLIGFLMVVLLVFAVVDYAGRRYRNAVKTFNSAVRAVSHYEGAIAKVALAFSRSGPLSGPCYEYSRRLMMGEGPIDAAVMARVPLQLQTAIALQTPAKPMPSDSSAIRSEMHEVSDAREMAMVDTTMMPVYGQFIYLTATALVTCNVLAFIAVFILPTLEAMFEEFQSTEMPYRWLFSAAPAIWILFLLAFIAVIVMPLLNRGHVFGARLPRWLPTMPRLAERKAEILNGLADGIDAGWPIGRSLAVGHSISTRSLERRSLDQAMRLIEQGVEPMESIRRAGWIDADEASWMNGTTPSRTAELLRTIADQGIRDARSNLRWIMAIFFPVLVILLGCCVLAYAFGFFATLMGLINALA